MSAGLQRPATPAPVLGKSFERPAPVPLRLATKARVWGDISGGALEPSGAATVSDQDRDALRRRFALRCMFCGLESLATEVHNLNHNHGDIRYENLGLADSLCHRWQHLGELGKGNALLVYLPGLSARDASHLLRTTLIALLSSQEKRQSDARKLLTWMASHHVYVDQAWGTSDPAAFASALARTVALDRDQQDLALANLALVIHPETLSAEAHSWRQELQARRSEASWEALYHDVMNAPI